ncbi:hypothetical protein RND71_001911 [Anisodus tanguticus]|uniref:Uncharacterized protein n=1 Tax=Anisodus tanguticus TaxID=243964 RepID=A0AAE1VYD3_9SOLA|nr:hypothetical protein RND71_001911 [Anisodus tanguticus]
MAQLWQAWANDQEPRTSIPRFLDVTTIQFSSTQVLISDSFYPPGYGPFENYVNMASPSAAHLQGISSRVNPTTTNVALSYSFPPPTVVQKRPDHPYGQVQQGQSSYPQHYYPPPIPQYSISPRHKWFLILSLQIAHKYGSRLKETPICDDREYKPFNKAMMVVGMAKEDVTPKMSPKPDVLVNVESVNFDIKILYIPRIQKKVEQFNIPGQYAPVLHSWTIRTCSTNLG